MPIITDSVESNVSSASAAASLTAIDSTTVKQFIKTRKSENYFLKFWIKQW